jgi:hypothetical protein
LAVPPFNAARPRAHRLTLAAEPLEDRSLPSGNVTAQVIGGMLRLDGDALHNQVLITGLEDNQAIITPLGDTTVNGSSSPITLGGILFAYDIRMGDGNDFVWITGTQGEIGVFVDMGNGNDGLTIDYAGHTGTTALFMGSGNDVISLGMGEYEGITILDLGDGDDQVVIAGSTIGPVLFHGSTGLDTISVWDVNFRSTPAVFGIEGVYTTLSPIANADSGTVRPGESVTLAVAANDLALGPPLDLASVRITSQPQQGTVRVNPDGTVTYTARASASGTDTFRYTIANTLGQTSTEATVTLTIGDGQPPPSTRGPVPTISTTASNPTNLTSIPFTVTFDRDVINFTAADVQVTNGTASGFTATNNRTFTFQVAPTTDGVVTIRLARGAAEDATGNASVPATQSIAVDRVRPTTTIRAGVAAGQTTIPFTVTFSEAVTDFTATDVNVTGGTLSNFTAVNPSTYTFRITPLAGASLVQVNVPSGVASDAAGNVNRVAPQFTTLASRTDAGMTSPTTPPSPTAPEWVFQSNGLGIWDVQTGTGPAVAASSTIGVFYTGWLLNGTVFDSARTDGAPASFPLSGLIQGWQLGIPGMQPGGIRRLYIPAALAYGSSGSGTIPPNSDLIFEIKLVAVV